jgi:hypothetical protein
MRLIRRWLDKARYRSSQVPPYDFRVFYLEAYPRRVHVGHATQVLDSQAPQFVLAWVVRSAPYAGLLGLQHETLRRPDWWHVRQLRDAPLLVGEGGNDEANSLRGRQVELQAYLDGLSYRVGHTPFYASGVVDASRSLPRSWVNRRKKDRAGAARDPDLLLGLARWLRGRRKSRYYGRLPQEGPATNALLLVLVTRVLPPPEASIA